MARGWSEESLKKFRDARNKAKNIVSNIKLKAYDGLYNRLNTKKGKKTIYKLVKLKKRKNNNIILNVLKIKMKILIKNKNKRMMKMLFKKLLNKNNLEKFKNRRT